jgi:cytochrome oxidase Cu insertion factor (SCO1/SenC/PrrC family)
MRKVRLVLHGLIPVVALLGLAAWWLGADRAVRIVEDATAVSVGGPFEMLDHRGRVVTEQVLLSRYTLIYFGYTSCPDVCPTELNTMAQAIDTLPPKQAARVQPMFVTVDPERDTVAVLGAYVAAFHPRMIGLTGIAEQVAAIKKAYRVYSRSLEKDDDGSYLVDHSTFIFLIGPDGRFLELLRPQLSIEEMADRLRRRLG